MTTEIMHSEHARPDLTRPTRSKLPVELEDLSGVHDPAPIDAEPDSLGAGQKERGGKPDSRPLRSSRSVVGDELGPIESCRPVPRPSA